MEKKATFAAGCFWGVEDKFMKAHGVLSTKVGYIGGNTENPTYSEVCSGKTGYKEGVEIIYDSEEVKYEELVDIFWSLHNPTTRNRQGPDVGEQYHSVIFYHNDEQKNIAEESKKKLNDSDTHTLPIVTDIEEATTFYDAEEYHQQYLQKTGRSCNI